MATYKIPQDVEAEDKLIGPFSFRQFIYLIISIGAGAASFFLIQAIFPLPLLTVATIPVFILFAVIALPLRKDQPMELYVLAMVRFFLKPKRRIWNPDGTTTSVVIEAPQTIEVQRSKDISQEEAAERLSRLADIVDTRGWSAKGVSVPLNTSVTSAVVDDTFSANDIMDTDSEQARNFDTLINQQQLTTRNILMAKMQQQLVAPVVTQQTDPFTEMYQQQTTLTTPVIEPYTEDTPATIPQFNPYPTNIHQKIINPQGSQPTPQVTSPVVTPATSTPEPPVTPTVSPAIINLANNNDLSIEAIAHEARRLSAKEDSDEVVISLR